MRMPKLAPVAQFLNTAILVPRKVFVRNAADGGLKIEL